MILSMTGFGKGSVEVENKKINVEIKSLNSKQFDLNLRLPTIFREKDSDIRNILSRKLLRGKIEVTVYYDNESDSTGAKFNLPVIKSYINQIKEIGIDTGISLPDDWFSVVLRLPDALKADLGEELLESDSRALCQAIEISSDQVFAFRQAEGKKLHDFFVNRISNIRKLLDSINPYEAERIPKIRERIEDNLQKLTSIEIDRGRLEQEMIYYIEKLDVNEEKQRLRQHLDYFVETMDAEAGQGKKLGFIAQEMGREINTLGSKSNHAEMQKIVVKMKDELEQIKEQVLNVL